MKKPFLIIVLLLIFIISGISFLVSKLRKDSKERLTDFIRMDQKLEQTVYPLEKENDSLLGLITNLGTWTKAQEVNFLTKEHKKYLESIKLEILDYKDPNDYELMDEPNTIFFTKSGLSEKGKQFVSRTDLFRENLMSQVENAELKTKINNMLSTEQIVDRNGERQNWQVYNFKDLPLFASITRLTRMQSDVSKIESDIYKYYYLIQQQSSPPILKSTELED